MAKSCCQDLALSIGVERLPIGKVFAQAGKCGKSWPLPIGEPGAPERINPSTRPAAPYPDRT